MSEHLCGRALLVDLRCLFDTFRERAVDQGAPRAEQLSRVDLYWAVGWVFGAHLVRVDPERVSRQRTPQGCVSGAGIASVE